jgi:SAM-dependent methyltransferase
VDISADELDVARGRATQRGLDNVEFRVADAGTDDLGPEAVDVICSRFGVMFFPDSTAAFSHIRSAARPGGRLAFACWQPLDQNDWMAVPREAIDSVVPLEPPCGPGQPGPYAFSEPDHVQRVLTDAGFTAIDLEDVRRTVHMGSSVDEAISFIRQMEYARTALDSAPADAADAAMDRVRQTLIDRAGPDGTVDLAARVWLVRATA